MAATGTRLREERETRGVSLEQIAEATGVGLAYLEAMEAGRFDALPGRAFGKLYIRAYAEVLAFDPRPLIELYDNERRPDNASASPARPAPAGSRPVAEAIARWKAARSDVETADPDARVETTEPPSADAEAEAEAVAESMEPAVTHEIDAPVAVDVVIEREPEPAAESVEPAVTLQIDAPVGPMPRTAGRRAWLVVGAIALALAGVYALMRRPATAPVTVPVASVPSPKPPAIRESEPAPAPPPAQARAPAPPRPTATPSGPPSELTIGESGTGRRVVAGRLEGAGDAFVEGDVVCFQTRVLGGRSGDVVRHVWIYEGKAQQSIPLRVSGPDWRTHSAKTIYRAGSWTVEARDAKGRVLASAAFTCRKR
jgi:hypothetical protein